MPVPVYLNRIATAVPPHQVHAKFLEYVPTTLPDERSRRLFSRLASKAHIETRYSVVEPAIEPERLDAQGFFRRGQFPSTAQRMAVYERSALPLASRAVRDVLCHTDPAEITHLVVTSCTGFYAPGLDLELQREFRLSNGLQRTIVGFMGCYAAFNGLKVARNAVRSCPEAKVLMVNLELCTLHMQEDFDFEQLLAFMQFADGCSASLISSAQCGIEIEQVHSDVVPEARDLITWHIGESGFNMHLSPAVPQALAAHVPELMNRWLGEEITKIPLWAVHPGGRAILDAVEDKLHLTPEQMRPSRDVLRKYGNMSSATIMFVLDKIMRDETSFGRGVGMAFGPGLTMESILFRKD